MPRQRSCWSSWNYLEDSKKNITVTYWMNKLQNLETERNIFVSLNPSVLPAKKRFLPNIFMIIHYLILTHSKSKNILNQFKV